MRKGFGPKFWGGMKDVEVTFRQLHLNVNIRTYPYNYQKKKPKQCDSYFYEPNE